VLWENGGVTDIGNLGANWWNTPTAINIKGRFWYIGLKKRF